MSEVIEQSVQPLETRGRWPKFVASMALVIGALTASSVPAEAQPQGGRTPQECVADHEGVTELDFLLPGDADLRQLDGRDYSAIFPQQLIEIRLVDEKGNSEVCEASGVSGPAASECGFFIQKDEVVNDDDNTIGNIISDSELTYGEAQRAARKVLVVGGHITEVECDTKKATGDIDDEISDGQKSWRDRLAETGTDPRLVGALGFALVAAGLAINRKFLNN